MLAAVRALLEDAFPGDFSEHDWQHCLGGSNCVIAEGPDIVAHAAVVPRTLRAAGRELRCGYVEGVAVREDRRGRGLGAAVMAAAEQLIAAGYDLGAMSSTEAGLGFYLGRGWQPWRGPTSVRTPTGTARTPDDDGAVLVLPLTTPLDLDAELTCDPRPGDPW